MNPGNEFHLNQGVGGGGEGGDSPMKQKTKEDDEIVVCVQNKDYQPC